MDFYTNVVQWGNFLLVRGVDKNQRVNFRLKYKPTLYKIPDFFDGEFFDTKQVVYVPIMGK